jgi:hypothetical protein
MYTHGFLEDFLDAFLNAFLDALTVPTFAVQNCILIAYLWVLGWMLLIDMFLTEDTISGFKNKRILTFSGIIID